VLLRGENKGMEKACEKGEKEGKREKRKKGGRKFTRNKMMYATLALQHKMGHW